ncbi:iron-containing alcohol dehydrogenase [Amycolatopsis azurea]|uniref:iron-containing alcohol dehydrogenase n=1 Tax=Amycolatopsis azurea TaxID=36819 RepID=UPI0037FD34F6
MNEAERANAVVQWECRTRVHAGEEAWNMLIAGGALRSRTVLVLGSGFAAANFSRVEEVRSRLDIPADRIQLVQAPATVEQAEVLSALLAGAGAKNVVAIGGSAALDVTKLACHQLADDRTLALVRARGARRGVVALPFEASEQVQQVLVPTTIGPAAELRPYAAVRLRERRCLVYGAGLPPRHAVIDSGFTESLTRQSILDGLLMSLIQFMDPYTDGEVDCVLAEAAIRTAIGLLVSLGVRAKDGRCASADRLLACYLNAARSGLTFAGRHPYVSRTWAIAAEMIGVLKLPPVTALAAVLPSLWRRIEDGDDRFGNRGRLRQVWGWIRAAGFRDLPADPADGIAELIRSWGIDGEMRCDRRHGTLIASRAVRFWGANVPGLAGIPAADLADMITGTVAANDVSARTGKRDELGGRTFK